MTISYKRKEIDKTKLVSHFVLEKENGEIQISPKYFEDSEIKKIKVTDSNENFNLYKMHLYKIDSTFESLSSLDRKYIKKCYYSFGPHTLENTSIGIIKLDYNQYFNLSPSGRWIIEFFIKFDSLNNRFYPTSLFNKMEKYVPNFILHKWFKNWIFPEFILSREEHKKYIEDENKKWYPSLNKK